MPTSVAKLQIWNDDDEASDHPGGILTAFLVDDLESIAITC